MYLDHKANAARNYPPALLIPRRSENPAASCIAEPSSTMNAGMAGGVEEGGGGAPRPCNVRISGLQRAMLMHRAQHRRG